MPKFNPNWLHTRRYVVAELIVEAILYEAADGQEFVTTDWLRAHVDYEEQYVNELGNAIRALVVLEVLEYTHVRGQYRILELENFFDNADGLANGEWEKRWKQRYT